MIAKGQLQNKARERPCSAPRAAGEAGGFPIQQRLCHEGTQVPKETFFAREWQRLVFKGGFGAFWAAVAAHGESALDMLLRKGMGESKAPRSGPPTLAPGGSALSGTTLLPGAELLAVSSPSGVGCGGAMAPRAAVTFGETGRSQPEENTGGDRPGVQSQKAASAKRKTQPACF